MFKLISFVKARDMKSPNISGLHKLTYVLNYNRNNHIICNCSFMY